MLRSLQPGEDSKLLTHKQPTSNLLTSSKTQDQGSCIFPSGDSQKEEDRRTNFLPLYKVQPTSVVTRCLSTATERKTPLDYSFYRASINSKLPKTISLTIVVPAQGCTLHILLKKTNKQKNKKINPQPK